MKLSDARGHYYTHTGLASTAARQLAFAGIAVIWIFKVNGTQVPATLSLPLILMVVTLALDLLQYALNSAIWGITSWVIERRLPDDRALAKDPDVIIWKHINFPGLVCFWAKLICVMIAYGYLFVRVFPLLFPIVPAVK